MERGRPRKRLRRDHQDHRLQRDNALREEFNLPDDLDIARFCHHHARKQECPASCCRIHCQPSAVSASLANTGLLAITAVAMLSHFKPESVADLAKLFVDEGEARTWCTVDAWLAARAFMGSRSTSNVMETMEEIEKIDVDEKASASRVLKIKAKTRPSSKAVKFRVKARRPTADGTSSSEGFRRRGAAAREQAGLCRGWAHKAGPTAVILEKTSTRRP